MLRSTLSLLSVSSFLNLATLVDAQQALDVTWISPLGGEVYMSGDTLAGRWKTDETGVSPSFRLCVQAEPPAEYEGDGGPAQDSGSTGNCGEAVWPTIEQVAEDGSYIITLALPNVTSTSQCYLEMTEDELNSVSPGFTLGPLPASNAAMAVASTSGPVVDCTSATTDYCTNAVAGASTGPIAATGNSSSGTPAAGGASPSDADADTPNSADASPQQQQPTSPAVSSESPQSASSTPTVSTASSSNIQTSTSSSAQPTPSSEEDKGKPRVSTPTAAFAVPLGLVLSLLVAGGGLALRRRRNRIRRKNDGATDDGEGGARHETQYTEYHRPPHSRHSTLSYGGFVALTAPGPMSRAGSDSSAGTSVGMGMMRAWRRDVSRYERRMLDGAGRELGGKWGDSYRTVGGGCVTDDETFVDADGRSVASSKHPPSSPSLASFYSSASLATSVATTTARGNGMGRQPTREPFWASRSQSRRTSVPVREQSERRGITQRGGESGRSIFQRGGQGGQGARQGAGQGQEGEVRIWGSLRRGRNALSAETTSSKWSFTTREPLPDPYPESEPDADPEKPGEKEKDEGTGTGTGGEKDAAANEAVMSSYYDFSPVPLSPSPNHPTQATTSPAGPGPGTLTSPETLHVRASAEQEDRLPEANIYSVVARKLRDRRV